MAKRTHTLELKFIPTHSNRSRTLKITAEELIKDWDSDTCTIAPENDARVRSAVLDGKELVGTPAVPKNISFYGFAYYLQMLLSGKYRQVTSIEWDTDGEDIPELPTEVLVPKKWDNEEVTDWLSDTYGFCVYGWAG